MREERGSLVQPGAGRSDRSWLGSRRAHDLLGPAAVIPCPRDLLVPPDAPDCIHSTQQTPIDGFALSTIRAALLDDCSLLPSSTYRARKFLILVIRHTLPSSYNITSPQGPRVHLPVTYFLFRDTTFHLVLALSASLRPKYGTPYLFTSTNPTHT